MDSTHRNASHDRRGAAEPGNGEETTSPQLRPHGDQRLPNAQARTAALEATLAELAAQRNTLLQEFVAVPSVAEKLPFHANEPSGTPVADLNAEKDAALQAAKAIIQKHIRRLNEYNELRDVGQGLMGIIAENRGARIKEVQEEFDISAKD